MFHSVAQSLLKKKMSGGGPRRIWLLAFHAVGIEENLPRIDLEQAGNLLTDEVCLNRCNKPAFL